MQTVVFDAINEFASTVTGALPRIIAGVVFVALAAVGVKLVMLVVRAVLGRWFDDEDAIYRQVLGTLVAAFLWFGVALTTLSVVGLEVIAASLGTATGFLALGVSYALSDMLADAVSGIYLIRDPDFEVGSEVAVGDMTGEVRAIELRKTRFSVGDDVVVRGNAEIEKRWTNLDAA